MKVGPRRLNYSSMPLKVVEGHMTEPRGCNCRVPCMAQGRKTRRSFLWHLDSIPSVSPWFSPLWPLNTFSFLSWVLALFCSLVRDPLVSLARPAWPVPWHGRAWAPLGPSQSPHPPTTLPHHLPFTPPSFIHPALLLRLRAPRRRVHSFYCGPGSPDCSMHAGVDLAGVPHGRVIARRCLLSCPFS